MSATRASSWPETTENGPHAPIRVEIASTDPDNSSVNTEGRQLRSPGRHLVSYEVPNYRDSPAVAQIIRHDT